MQHLIVFAGLLLFLLLLLQANEDTRETTYNLYALEEMEREYTIHYEARSKGNETFFHRLLRQNFTSKRQLLSQLINPYSGYVLCHYYLSTEVQRVDIDVTGKKDLRSMKNYSTIRNGSVIMVQNNFLEHFVDHILPYLRNNVILITGQWMLPEIAAGPLPRQILNHQHIVKWFSQNPRMEYVNEKKYLPFPYGFKDTSLLPYYAFLLKNHDDSKIVRFSHLFCSIHKHLPLNHIRKMYPVVCSGEKLPYNSFLNKVAQTSFLLSPVGDRDDCYRHWEAIGLNSVPISNVGAQYKTLFGNNMMYSNTSTIIKLVQRGGDVEGMRYKQTNRDLITLDYWRQWMHKRVLFQ